MIGIVFIWVRVSRLTSYFYTLGLNGCRSYCQPHPRKISLNLVIVIRILVIHKDGVTPWLLSHHLTHRAITHKASCSPLLHSCSPLNRDPWAHLGRFHSSARTPVQQRLIKLAYTRILRNHFSLSRMENHRFKVNV